MVIKFDIDRKRKHNMQYEMHIQQLHMRERDGACLIRAALLIVFPNFWKVTRIVCYSAGLHGVGIGIILQEIFIIFLKHRTAYFFFYFKEVYNWY